MVRWVGLCQDILGVCVGGRVRFYLVRDVGDTLCIGFDVSFVLAYFIRWSMLGFEAF